MRNWVSGSYKDSLLRPRNTRCKNLPLVAQHEQICCVTSCEFDEKKTSTKRKFVVQSRPALSNFLRTATNVFVAWQVDHTRWKTRNVDPKLATKQCPRQVEGFCISCFAAFEDEGPRREELVNRRNHPANEEEYWPRLSFDGDFIRFQSLSLNNST